MNAISTMEEGLEESPVMVLQEVVPVPHSVETEGQTQKETLSSSEETIPPSPAHTY